jgi:hypothetical protein
MKKETDRERFQSYREHEHAARTLLQTQEMVSRVSQLLSDF